MERHDRGSSLDSFKRGTFIFICVTSGISLFVLFFWLLGVPGVKNAYARGWVLGLQTLYHYVIGCSILLITYIVIAKIAQRFRAFLSLNWLVISIFWPLFIYSVFQLYQAFKIMFSGS